MKFDTTECKKLLVLHEGMEFRPYRDTVGILTIGVGHNMQSQPLPSEMQDKLNSGLPLSKQDCLDLLEKDLASTVDEISKYAWFDKLTQNRKSAICNMYFNLGRSKFAGFRKLISALERGDYLEASHQMISSFWARQVGGRAVTLADMILEG